MMVVPLKDKVELVRILVKKEINFMGSTNTYFETEVAFKEDVVLALQKCKDLIEKERENLQKEIKNKEFEDEDRVVLIGMHNGLTNALDKINEVFGDFSTSDDGGRKRKNMIGPQRTDVDKNIVSQSSEDKHERTNSSHEKRSSEGEKKQEE